VLRMGTDFYENLIFDFFRRSVKVIRITSTLRDEIYDNVSMNSA
jgi:hypothetical protein